MALDIRPLEGSLQLKFDLGTDDNGRKITRTKTFNKISPSAVDQDVYDVAQALVGLQVYSTESIRRVTPAEYVNI